MSRSRIAMLSVAAAAVLMLAFGAATASATSGAHFFSATGSVADNGALQVSWSWDEAGVGNATVDYILSADASATYACINGGGTTNGVTASIGDVSRTFVAIKGC